MIDPVEAVARAIGEAYYRQIAETGGMTSGALKDMADPDEWREEAIAALAVAVELRKSEIRKAISPTTGGEQ